MNNFTHRSALAVLLGLSSLVCFAQDGSGTSKPAKQKKVVLNVGDKAPTFTGMDDENKKWNSKERAGKKIYVVYFYPADMTPGCTKQACSYRDAMKEFESKEVEIIGISGDSVENHQHFKREHKLNFTLLADPKGQIAKAFGVPSVKGGAIQRMIGGEQLTLERGVTTMRWTFIIDREWKIAYKKQGVRPAKDSQQVLKAIQKMLASEAVKKAA